MNNTHNNETPPQKKNMGKTLKHIKIGSTVLHRTPVVQEIRTRIDKWIVAN
jgi:hypothetical protein